MLKTPLTILGLNPGSKYLGIAVFEGADLRYWAIKVLNGDRSNKKKEKAKKILSDIIDRYEVNVLAIKKLHPSRSSKILDRLVTSFKDFSKKKRLKVREYSLKILKDYFSPCSKTNKKRMAELIVAQYPFLDSLLKKEKRNKNPYFVRMFEAIALGIVCVSQLNH